MDSKFNAIVSELILKAVITGLTNDQALSKVAEDIKSALLANGLYEEMRARAVTIAQEEVTRSRTHPH